MKPKFNKMWLLMSVVIIGNILIFSLMSKKLESYVYDKTLSSKMIEGV